MLLALMQPLATTILGTGPSFFTAMLLVRMGSHKDKTLGHVEAL